MKCDTTAFLNSIESETTYAAVPDPLPVGYVISSECGADSDGRFGHGTTREVIKCTAKGPDGILNQPPSGCHSTPFFTFNVDVTYSIVARSVASQKVSK